MRTARAELLSSARADSSRRLSLIFFGHFVRRSPGASAECARPQTGVHGAVTGAVYRHGL